MNKVVEERTIQALAAVGSLAGLSLKKVTTGDDLKDYTLTLIFTGVSAGLVQERFEFDREDAPRQTATVDANGHVVSVTTEKDETITDPDEGLPVSDRKDYDSEKIGAATGDETKPDIHLVGEAAAIGKKRR